MASQLPPHVAFRAATNTDQSRIQELIFDVLTEYGLPPDPAGTDADLGDIEGHYTRAGGWFEVVEDDRGNLLGTVALHRESETVCELRKMYLAKEARGLGLGRRMLERAIAQAKAMGFKTVVLETAGALKEAIALYTRYGFTRRFHPLASSRCDQAFVLELEKNQ